MADASVRYNRSTILGRSDRYDEKNDPQHIKWLGQTDEQTDDKVTWQLALKKQFNDHFTMRATGGTYYRLLNMYEIAGDGARYSAHAERRRHCQCLPYAGRRQAVGHQRHLGR